jgi:hypothetical protein
MAIAEAAIGRALLAVLMVLSPASGRPIHAISSASVVNTDIHVDLDPVGQMRAFFGLWQSGKCAELAALADPKSFRYVVSDVYRPHGQDKPALNLDLKAFMADCPYSFFADIYNARQFGPDRAAGWLMGADLLKAQSYDPKKMSNRFSASERPPCQAGFGADVTATLDPATGKITEITELVNVPRYRDATAFCVNGTSLPLPADNPSDDRVEFARRFSARIFAADGCEDTMAFVAPNATFVDGFGVPPAPFDASWCKSYADGAFREAQIDQTSFTDGSSEQTTGEVAVMFSGAAVLSSRHSKTNEPCSVTYLQNLMWITGVVTGHLRITRVVVTYDYVASNAIYERCGLFPTSSRDRSPIGRKPL